MDKHFIYSVTSLDSELFSNVFIPKGNSFTNNFSLLIKDALIEKHNNGAGSLTTSGIVLNANYPHKLILRETSSKKILTSNTGDVVYGRLHFEYGDYVIKLYTYSNEEKVYVLTIDITIDLDGLLFSDVFDNIPWTGLYQGFNFFTIDGVEGNIGILGDQGIQGDPGIQGDQGVGLKWYGNWNIFQVYLPDSIIRYDGAIYIAIRPTTNHIPNTNPYYWELMLSI